MERDNKIQDLRETLLEEKNTTINERSSLDSEDAMPFKNLSEIGRDQSLQSFFEV